MDALAIGALLCLAERRRWTMPRAAWAAAFGCFAAGAALSLGWGEPALSVALYPLLIALASGWAVWRSRTGFAGPTGALLGWRPVTYLGEISYGIYLYHMVTGEMFHHLPVLWRIAEGGWPRFIVHVGITVALAAASYRLMERPLLNRVRTGGAPGNIAAAAP
jgi:peptidoglycan/LPS O-acetylase OafA/YrhL